VTDPEKAVFLSYASQDTEAAQTLCNALRAAGIEVWFDQSELRGGDAWDQKIRREIRECALFIPIISTNTQARTEGYFRLEWRLADQRTHLMGKSRAFLVPVCIDDTRDADADVPESFAAVQWTRLPGGDTPPAFTARIVTLLGAPVAAGGSTTVPVTPPRAMLAAPAKATPRVRLAAIGAATLVVIGLAYVVFERFEIPKQTSADRHVAAAVPAPAVPAIPEKSVAVLPFVDMSEKKDQEYFSDGLSEELIDMLTKISGLHVPARTSSFYFKGKSEDIPTIAKRLLVAHVLEGSVRKSGNHLRVTAQLIRADNGYHLWSETYDRKLDDIFKVQDEIAGAVVKALKVSLMEAEGQKVAPTANSEAYTLYLRARALISQGKTTDNGRVVSYLRQAIQLDPKFAHAWAQLTIALTAQYLYGLLPYQQARDEALRAAQQALKLDPTLSDAHIAAARVHFLLEWDWATAELEIQRALRLDPGDAEAQHWAGIFAWTFGDLEKAIGLFQHAVDLDPLSAVHYTWLGHVNLTIGRYAEAEQAFRKAIELAPPDAFGAAGDTLKLLLASGRPAEAISASKQLEDERDRLCGQALAYFALGRKDDSDTALANLKRQFADDGAWDIARVHAYRGEIDEAFEWLNRAYRQRDGAIYEIKTDWLLTKLRGDPRYKAFLRKMNLPE
jgi:TolB-like protein/Tfp pilus assembly protein PilF